MATPNDATRYRIFQSVLGRLRSSPGLTAAEAAQREQWEWPFDRYRFQYGTFLAIAERARDSIRLGENLQDDPDRVPRIREIPGQTGIDPDRPRYMYSIVLEVTDGSGALASTRIDVRSDVRLSFNEALALAMPLLSTNDSPGRGNTRTAIQANPGASVNAYLISVIQR